MNVATAVVLMQVTSCSAHLSLFLSISSSLPPSLTHTTTYYVEKHVIMLILCRLCIHMSTCPTQSCCSCKHLWKTRTHARTHAHAHRGTDIQKHFDDTHWHQQLHCGKKETRNSQTRKMSQMQKKEEFNDNICFRNVL